MHNLAKLTLILVLGVLISCPQGGGDTPPATADGAISTDVQSAGAAANGGAEAAEGGLNAAGGGVAAAPGLATPGVGADGGETPPMAVPEGSRGPGEGIEGQFIIIYSGDTLSIPLPHQDYEPSQGGLCALAGGITDYEGQIVEYNRRRVINEGGDPDGIRADLKRGFLGEHPFVLLDYGGWARPNDYAGEHYVGPYLELFQALHYTAVGSRLHAQLAADRWAAYNAVSPDGFRLLASTGTPKGAALAADTCVTRDVRGTTWRILGLPLADATGDAQVAQMLADWDSLADEYHLGAEPCIVLVSGASGAFYNELLQDPRATVVIGAPVAKAVREGYGEIDPDAPLMLPEVKPGGRSIGVCHLYYHHGGSRPDMYFYTTWVCEDDPARPLPFRRQVAAAVEAHRAAVAEHDAVD